MYLLSFCLNFICLNYVLEALLRYSAYFSCCECDKTKADYLHETNENFAISYACAFFSCSSANSSKMYIVSIVDQGNLFDISSNLQAI